MNTKFVGTLPSLSIEYSAFQKLVSIQKKVTSHVVVWLVGNTDKKAKTTINDVVIPLQQTGYFMPTILEKTFKRAEWEFKDDNSIIGFVIITTSATSPVTANSTDTFSTAQKTFIDTTLASIFSGYDNDYLVLAHLYYESEKSLIRADIHALYESVVFEDMKINLFMNFDKNDELKKIVDANIFSSKPNEYPKTEYPVGNYAGNNSPKGKISAPIVEKNPKIEDIV